MITKYKMYTLSVPSLSVSVTGSSLCHSVPILILSLSLDKLVFHKKIQIKHTG